MHRLPDINADLRKRCPTLHEIRPEFFYKLEFITLRAQKSSFKLLVSIKHFQNTLRGDFESL